MALVVKDRVKETTATTGTGTLTLAGAVTGFQSFSSALSDGDTTYYAIFESSTGEWEVGLGTFTASGTTLARTTVLASSNSGSAVNLTAGAADVFITQPATKAAYFDGSGDLVLNQDPTANLQAATKQYVDTIAAAGIHYHDPVRVEQEGNLNATYDNGTSGVGATLTNAGTQAALVIDGVTMVVNDRVLIYEQTNAAHNGVYTVTNVGSASTNWVLTRATDADSYGPSDPDALGQGDAFFVSEGDAGAGETYVMTTEGTITFGTTDIVFSQISATQVYSAGNGLTLTGTTFAAGAGTGVTVNANDIAIGQDVGTTADVTFNSVSASLTGNVTGDVNGDLTGNADTATAWATSRTVSLTGDVTGSATGVDGSGNVSIATTIGANSVALGTDTTGNYVATGAVSGNGLSGSASAEGATFTVTSNATNANTASTIVFRDASGNFSAGTITADLDGNASTATSATNADTVDSLHASQFLRSDAADTATGTITISTGTSPALVTSSDDWGEQLEVIRSNSSVNWPSIKFSNASGELGRVFVDASNDYLMYVKAGTTNYETVWTNYTDGSGSGLDADLLDGQQGSYYAPISGADLTNNPTVSNYLTIGNSNTRLSGSNDLLEIYGNTSSFLLGVQDGSGRVQMRWNASRGTNPTYLVSSEPSARFEIVDVTSPTNSLWKVDYAAAGTAGNAISYTNIMSLGTTTFTYNSNTVWHAGNDGSGSGLDADTTDGYQASESSTGSTLAARNSSGDLYMRYGISSYLNMSHASATRSSDTVFYSSTDNYLRKNDATGFKNSLGLGTGDSPSFNNVAVAASVYHEGDTDTYLSFGTNTITLATGGSSEITVNTTGVRLGDTGNGYFQPVSGQYGSIQIDGGAHGGWEGYSIGGRAVFMHNNANTTGIYNDVNNHWLFAADNGGAANLYYNGSNKIQTTSSGINVTGTAEVDTLQFSDGSTQTSAGASTGKAIAMAIVFG
jgi:hypothetical protein